MGINYASFLHLAKLSRSFMPPGETLMLGRQKFDLRINRYISRFHFSLALRAAGIKRSIKDFAQADRYSETMLKELGFGDALALDASKFEGASLIWDLNKPINSELKERFGLVIDGGTLEHVFDVAQAMENVAEMLTPGGRFISFTPFNGYPGHGFYQFSPELVWTYWKSTRGFKVNNCYIAKPKGHFLMDLEDTRTLGKRIQFNTGQSIFSRIPSGRLLMCYEIEKPIEKTIVVEKVALQSDYETRWAQQASQSST